MWGKERLSVRPIKMGCVQSVTFESSGFKLNAGVALDRDDLSKPPEIFAEKYPRATVKLVETLRTFVTEGGCRTPGISNFVLQENVLTISLWAGTDMDALIQTVKTVIEQEFPR